MEFQTSKGNKNFFEISGVQDIGGGVVGAGEELQLKIPRAWVCSSYGAWKIRIPQCITICVLNVCWADAPGREAEFEAKAGAFEHQANQVADTAIQLANAGGNTNKRLLDQIRQNAEEVNIPPKALISIYKIKILL